MCSRLCSQRAEFPSTGLTQRWDRTGKLCHSSQAPVISPRLYSRKVGPEASLDSVGLKKGPRNLHLVIILTIFEMEVAAEVVVKSTGGLTQADSGQGMGQEPFTT